MFVNHVQIHTGLQYNVIRTPQRNALPENLPTLPEKLRDAGYSTYLVGKWHLGHYKYDVTPIHRGFDDFFGKNLFFINFLRLIDLVSHS